MPSLTRSALITSVALLLLTFGCNNPTGKSALPDAKSPEVVVVSFINMLRQNQCETALAYVSGNLKSTYQKMVEAKGFMVACESWRDQYLPYSKVEYSHEEVLESGRKKVWLRLYKESNVFDVFSVEVEDKGGRWWVVAV